jgi:hypothetical protein
MQEFIYSGHETFSLRISWLPKATAALEKDEDVFSNPRKGMASLGLGKNMINSLGFWVLATGVGKRAETGRLCLTDFGKYVFGRKQQQGYDPFLENPQTLWLIHWHLCQGWEEDGKMRRPYAWHFFANVLRNDEVTASEAVDHFAAGPVASGKALSRVTLLQHFDVFVKTYVEGETSGFRSSPEETLDSPLTTLGLIKVSGDRKLPSGKRETVYRINTRPKASLANKTFRFCLHQWWTRNHSHDQTLTVRQIAHSPDSPGAVFRLPETAIYANLETLAKVFPREFEIVESQNQRAVRRKGDQPDEGLLLNKVYS